MLEGKNESFARSSVIAAVEPVVGFDIESLTDEEIANLSKDELDYIRIAIDEALKADAKKIGTGGIAGVVPIDYAGWGIGSLVRFKNHMALSLLYDKIIMPVGGIASDFIAIDRLNSKGRIVGEEVIIKKRRKTKMVLAALRENATFLRSGELFPFSTSIYFTRSLERLAERVSNKVKVEKLNIRPHDIAPVIEGIVGSERKMLLRNHFKDFYQQLFLVRRWAAIPALSDHPVWNLWQALANECLMPKIQSSECKIGSTLSQLSLPGLQELTQQDIVSLHRNSEAFADWRIRLSVVMRNLRTRIEAGDEPEIALKEELLPLHDTVRAMEKELKGGSLRQLILKNKTSVEIGAVAAFASAPLLSYLGVDPSIVKDLLKVGSTAIVALLWSVLFGKNNSGSSSVVNVYNKVFLKS